MPAVSLDADIVRRLETLAARTGRTKTSHVREAIEAHLDDLEDFYLAEERRGGFNQGNAIPLETLKEDFHPE